MPGTRPVRVGDQIRQELGDLLARGVRDPGLGFVTVTHVRVSADLQTARVFYTVLGDDAARRDCARALARAASFLRRQIAGRMRLRRAPELLFQYDDSIARAERVETLFREIETQRTDDEPDDDATR